MLAAEGVRGSGTSLECGRERLARMVKRGLLWGCPAWKQARYLIFLDCHNALRRVLLCSYDPHAYTGLDGEGSILPFLQQHGGKRPCTYSNELFKTLDRVEVVIYLRDTCKATRMCSRSKVSSVARDMLRTRTSLWKTPGLHQRIAHPFTVSVVRCALPLRSGWSMAAWRQ